MGKLCDSCRRAGRVWCPHNAALEIRSRIAGSLKQDMFGPSPPNLFVGHNFYPNVYWGPLVSAGGPAQAQEDPVKMYGMSLEEIIESRASMVRGMKRGAVKAKSRMLETAQEAVMSVKSVDVEARFSKAPVFSLEFDDISHPVGASAPIEKFRIADNPEIPKKVDELHEEGVKAADALRELLLSGFDVHYLSKLLTSGILGREDARKLVPTKWAITATDDMAAKRFMESVRDYRELSEARVYSNTYLENHFEILLLPGAWEYEQFETALTPELERLRKKRTGRGTQDRQPAARERRRPCAGIPLFPLGVGGLEIRRKDKHLGGIRAFRGAQRLRAEAGGRLLRSALRGCGGALQDEQAGPRSRVPRNRDWLHRASGRVGGARERAARLPLAARKVRDAGGGPFLPFWKAGRARAGVLEAQQRAEAEEADRILTAAGHVPAGNSRPAPKLFRFYNPS